MSIEKVRPTNYPRDLVLSVKSGATAMRGWATAGRGNDKGDDVIIMAHNLGDLNHAFFELTGEYPRRSACYEVVMMQRVDAEIDDEI